MRYVILAVVMACATYVFLCGCGTSRNLVNDKPKVYGGVRVEIQAVTEPLTESLGLAAKPKSEGDDYLKDLNVIVGIALLVDLPFTIIGDTVTLPWTVTAELKRRVEPGAKTEK
jgi:uncharacterized protein YceK